MTRRSNYGIVAATGLFMALSCAPAEKITVRNVSEQGLKQPGSMLYALPQTTMDVCVTAEYTIITPGPYRQYAEKYLGLHDVPVREETHWRITGIHLGSHLETDPDFVYSLEGRLKPGIFPQLDALAADSMVIDLSKPIKHGAFYTGIAAQPGLLPFADLSVKRNFEAEKDLAVSVALPDSGYAVRPAGKKVPREKTLEQKAEEAANFLIKLKKRRFKLISGQYDSMPEGIAMESALAELARLEENYLALFIGKKTVSTISRIYHFTPSVVKKNDRVVLFRFSGEEGFVDARESKGKPVLLEMASAGKTRSFESSQTPGRLSDNSVIYRIPEQVVFRLLDGEALLSETTLPVFQWGVLVRMMTPPAGKK
jgi:hypothetical protein